MIMILMAYLVKIKYEQLQSFFFHLVRMKFVWLMINLCCLMIIAKHVCVCFKWVILSFFGTTECFFIFFQFFMLPFFYCFCDQILRCQFPRNLITLLSILMFTALKKEQINKITHFLMVFFQLKRFGCEMNACILLEISDTDKNQMNFFGRIFFSGFSFLPSIDIRTSSIANIPIFVNYY